ISFAAPDAAHISLYWSGNHTVLKAWASQEIISRHSESRGNLQKITLHASPVSFFFPGASYIGTSEGPPAQTWIDNMENFRAALMSIHRLRKSTCSDPVPRVKVALIDDGVDLLSLETHAVAEAITGMSYVPPEGRTERPWHQSTEGHGTVMANMMMRLNPWISLDVMRIHGETSSVSGGNKVRVIFADSAAEAIEDAITREVDIISMSWTVRNVASIALGMSGGSGTDVTHRQQQQQQRQHQGKASSYEVAVRALHRAIARARDSNILMFCSAADDIQLLGRDSLPFCVAPNHIFRIGASLPLGQRDPASEDARSISYFFPGNKVAEATSWRRGRGGRTLEPVEYYNGSSVSTALAAGLASVILHCVRVVREYRERRKTCQEEDGSMFAEWDAKLRSHESMRAAFDNINIPENEDKKFLPVWGLFGEASKQIMAAEDEDVKMSQLEKLVVELCRKI
ncbi:hypothetical protein M419DRAFT_88795, partial [Trichoderma reesei RUT C-30]